MTWKFVTGEKDERKVSCNIIITNRVGQKSGNMYVLDLLHGELSMVGHFEVKHTVA